MKCLLLLRIIAVILLMLMPAVPAAPGTQRQTSPEAGERIDWLVISGGAVDGSGGGLAVVGTVGQTGTGESAGGGYRLFAGYWQDFGGGAGGCCEGRVGDANGLGGDEPTIGDISVLIDAKFISGTCVGVLDCLPEADINQSGGSVADCSDITIGDISYLIDYLFITGPSLVV